MITGLANTMSENNEVDVCLMYPPTKEDIFIKKLSKKIKVYNMGKKGKGFSAILPFKVARFFMNHKYDVVQLHGFFYFYILAVLLFHKKMKFFYTVHNDAYLESSRWDRRIFFLKRTFFRLGWMHPITISDGSQSSFEKLYSGCKNTKIFNGIPSPPILSEVRVTINQNKLTEQTKVFFNPGRVCYQKNQLTLVKVFKRLIEEGNDVLLLIAGQCQDISILDQLKPYFSERIRYIGEIDNIPSLLKYCDAMVLPSLFEGLPVVLLEALAVGCPPICSPVGGVPDIVKSGYNGLLSNGCSEQDFLGILHRFLSMSPKEIEDMKRNAHDSFSKYEIHNTTAEYLSAYDRF